jgi:hypothetical protein
LGVCLRRTASICCRVVCAHQSGPLIYLVDSNCA